MRTSSLCTTSCPRDTRDFLYVPENNRSQMIGECGADLIRNLRRGDANRRNPFRSFLELPLQLGYEFRFLDNDCEFTACVEALSR